MSRLPIRLRLTLAFALAMAGLLAATGLFVYVRLGDELDHTIDQGLRSRATDVVALVREGQGGLGGSAAALIEADESFAQVLAPSGEIVDTAPQVAASPLLTPDELARASAGTILLDRTRPPVGDEPARLLATPTDTPDGRLIVVVGASTGDRQEALDGLRTQLLLGGPIALLVASLAGYALAGVALAPVERARRRERRLVADASHELRRPLTLMKAELEVTLRAPPDDERREAALRSTLDQVDALARLADDLLLIAQADQGRLPIRGERLSAGALLTTVRRRFEPAARERGRAIELEAQARELMADRLRLEQALGNLVDNALRHGAGTVTLTAADDDGAVVLSVRDEGAGIPADFAPQAFDRFTRADPSRTAAGAGLGLSIVAAIAEAHGGTVEIAGPSVHIRLPRDGG